MALIGLSVTKRVAFRDSTQEFNNTYYYKNGALGGNPNEAEGNALIDEVVTEEKAIHSTVVSFVYARLWTYGTGETLNHMVAQKALTGTGSSGAEDPNMDRERALLFRWRAGTDSRGNPVYLRKYYHTCGGMGLVGTFTASQHANKTGFSTGERAAFAAKVQPLTRIGSPAPGDWIICGPTGRDIADNSLEMHRYIEHHQLGDQWRG